MSGLTPRGGGSGKANRRTLRRFTLDETKVSDMGHFDFSPERILVLPVLLFSIICHEIGHAYAAYRGGDDTARLQGRLSLNPMAHIDPIGTILIPILQLFGNIPLIGWAKPVPVNPLRLRSAKWDLVVSLAGVAVNLGLAIGAIVLLRILFWVLPSSFWSSGGADGEMSIGMAVFLMLLYGVVINFSLMVFNLLPIPPLDGSHILLHFIRTRDSLAFRVFEFLERFGFIILLVLVFTGRIRYVLGPLFWSVYRLLELILQINLGPGP